VTLRLIQGIVLPALLASAVVAGESNGGASPGSHPFPSNYPVRTVFLIARIGGRPPIEKSLDRFVERCRTCFGKEAEWVLSPGNAQAPSFLQDRETPPTSAVEIEYVHVLYVGWSFERELGSSGIEARNNGEVQTQPYILIYQDNIDKYRWHGPGRLNLECRTLLHEYGHLCGLVENGSHRKAGSFECSYSSCLMAPSTFWGGVLRGLEWMVHFGRTRPLCRACRKDMEGLRSRRARSTGTGVQRK
jgi:hypothetical protein